MLPTSCLQQGAELLSHLYISYLQVISAGKQVFTTIVVVGGGGRDVLVCGRGLFSLGGVCFRWAGFAPGHKTVKKKKKNSEVLRFRGRSDVP